MNNQPWECPRCGRINAPFTPSCFCKKDEQSYLEKVLKNSDAQYQSPLPYPYSFIPMRKDHGWLTAQDDTN